MKIVIIFFFWLGSWFLVVLVEMVIYDYNFYLDYIFRVIEV